MRPDTKVTLELTLEEFTKMQYKLNNYDKVIDKELTAMSLDAKQSDLFMQKAVDNFYGEGLYKFDSWQRQTAHIKGMPDFAKYETLLIKVTKIED